MNHFKKIVFSLLLIHLLILVTTQFTAWPEMLFWPYLLIKGWLPYQDIGIAHSPLLIIQLAAFYKFVGVGIWQQKIFSWLIALSTDIVLAYVFSKIYDQRKSLLALFFYILLQAYFEGNGIWFDHSLAIYSLLIFYFLHEHKYIGVGILFALALITKQTAVWFSLPIFLHLLSTPKKKEFLVEFSKGFIPAILAFLLALNFFGILRDYFEWSIIFGIGILPKLAARVSSLRILIAALFPYLVFVPLLLSNRNKKTMVLLLWSIVGAFGTIPRFELFHFQPALPFLALAYAVHLQQTLKSNGNKLLLVLPLLTLILVSRGIYRKIYLPDRFYGETDKKVVETIKKITSADQEIFVTNYWDNLYPLTNTIPAIRPFIPQLTQYVNQPGKEDQILDDLVSSRPQIIVRGEFNTQASKIFRFVKINDFIDNNYRKIDRVGEIEILKTDK